ncbi:MAG: hypothetical protein NT042_12240 [Sulfuritalea sp.]|nr:hypothetical protein [Sulfuritalea sp.]
MNKPDQPSSSVDDTDELTDEELAGQSRAGPIVIQKKAFFTWLAAAAGVASALTLIAIVSAGRFHSQEEISRLETVIGKLTDEKQAALKQLDELRSSHYAQVIAERRCEVIDGLEDCLKAGLKRPERFAEIDRQFLEAKRPPAAKPPVQGTATTAGTAARTPAKIVRSESTAKEVAVAAPPGNRKLTLDEFAKEISKIPGIAVEGNVSDSQESPTPEKKGRKNSAKPGAQGPQ